MGRTQRKTNKYLELYRKTLKRKVLTVIGFSQPGTSQEEFFQLFKEVYPDEVRSMERNYEFYQEKNKRRSVGKPLEFPPPSQLIFEMALFKLKQIDIASWNPHQAGVTKRNAIEESLRAQQKRREIYRKNNISTQEVTPSYILTLMRKYWRESRAETRLFIVQECAKYKNDKTILFFRQVMAGEDDWFIRNGVLRTLQRFDEVVYLPPKGSGKREKYDTLVNRYGCDYKEDIGKGPREIMEEFYKSEYIQELRDFDVFVSHAVANEQIVDRIVDSFNSSGLVAFVDWKSDRIDLNRSKSNEFTADVLQIRMRQSRCLILVRTRASDTSVWAAWEIGYFSALGRPIVVYDAEDDLEMGPEFVRSFPQLHCNDSILRIVGDSGEQEFSDWFKVACIEESQKVERTNA